MRTAETLRESGAQLPLHLGRPRVPPRRQHRRGADHAGERGRRVASCRPPTSACAAAKEARPQPRPQLRRERHRAHAPAPRDAVGRAHQRGARGGSLRAVPHGDPAAAARRGRRSTTSCCCACATRPAASSRRTTSSRPPSATASRPAIDRWVIENAFRWLVSEADEREKLALCSINLSGQSLGDDKFLPFVIDQFHRSGLDALQDLLRDHRDGRGRELLAGEPLHPGAEGARLQVRAR